MISDFFQHVKSTNVPGEVDDQKLHVSKLKVLAIILKEFLKVNHTTLVLNRMLDLLISYQSQLLNQFQVKLML